MNDGALVLHQRVKKLGRGTLHCREMDLRLAEDGRHVLLSRYVERYGLEHLNECVMRQHRVPLADMIRWMINHGERVEV
jgi:hypothetical protein